jgi:hypothetical protein
MAVINELLSGIHRYFPNVMTASLIVIGLLTAKVGWVLVGVGAILLAIVVLILQYTINKMIGLGDLPGADVLKACSIIPTATGTFRTTPSVWMSLTAFFLTYIIVNASNVYTTTPAKKAKDSIPVQQRKSVGILSMLAVAILFILLLIPRYASPCESTIGTILGLVVGGFAGWGWWQILNACGADIYPDIHSVMIGLKPASLRTSPVACVPK